MIHTERDAALSRVGEDKTQNLSTTSIQFKTDLWDYFASGYSGAACIEFGTHKGQTTHILSHIFKTVYTINRTPEALLEAKQLNHDRDNITYIPFDLYGGSVLDVPEPITMAFIDAGHSYTEVVSDIQRVVRMPRTSPSFIVFDDYGIWSGVSRAVDEMVSNGVLQIVRFIGHPEGYDFGRGAVITNVYEGVICKLLV